MLVFHLVAPWVPTHPLQMSIVAQIVNTKAQATNTVYYLDDGTGRIEARRWRDANMDSSVDPNDRLPCVFLRALRTRAG